MGKTTICCRQFLYLAKQRQNYQQIQCTRSSASDSPSGRNPIVTASRFHKLTSGGRPTLRSEVLHRTRSHCVSHQNTLSTAPAQIEPRGRPQLLPKTH